MSDGAWSLDAWARRSDGGRLLCGGAPGRLMRLSGAGAVGLDRLLAGEEAGTGAAELAERLAGAGLIHPVPPRGPAGAALTTVIPARDAGPGLPVLVRSLLGGRSGGGGREVVVVDDGSTDGSPAAAGAAGARTIANRGRPGPAGARNTGLRAAGGELVAFLDADCAPAAGWTNPLAWLLEGQRSLALAAPRVHGVPGPSALARYETAYSPLDLGGARGLVGPGRRIGYVPSTALVGRRAALLEVGGFDEELRFGEDVDLTLRLLAAGWLVRYEPAAAVGHRPRPDLAGFARQRFGYGTSAARLDALHPGSVAPLRLGRHSAAVLAGAALGSLRAGPRGGLLAAAVGTAASAALAARRGGDPAARRALAGAALRAHAEVGRHLARSFARDWLPLSLAAAARSRRAAAVLALALALDAARAARRGGQPASLAARLALRGADHLAYSAGLWRGMLAARSPSAAVPRLAPSYTSPPRAVSSTGRAGDS